MRPVDVAWLAGLLEGEGYFCLNRGRYPRIDLRMTDRDVIEKVAAMWHSGVWEQKPKTERHKTVWKTDVSGPRAVGLMMTLYLYLGERRQERIRTILQTWRGN